MGIWGSKLACRASGAISNNVLQNSGILTLTLTTDMEYAWVERNGLNAIDRNGNAIEPIRSPSEIGGNWSNIDEAIQITPSSSNSVTVNLATFRSAYANNSNLAGLRYHVFVSSSPEGVLGGDYFDFYFAQYSRVEAPNELSLEKSETYPGASVELSWDGAKSGTNNPISRYEVWRATSLGGAYEYLETVVIADIKGSTTVYAPSTNGSSYYYKVKTLGSVAGYDSELSEEYATLTCSYSVLDEPKNVTIGGETTHYAKSGEEVILAWDAVSDGVNNPLTGYTVYRDGTQYGTTTETSILVPTNEVDGEYYTYTVYANGQYSSSDASNAVKVYTYSDVKAPDSVLINGESAAYVSANTQVSLSWSGANSGTYNAIIGYQVYQDGVEYITTEENRILVPSNPEYGGRYEYSIVTLGERGNSEPSPVAIVYSYASVFAPTNVSVSNLAPDAGDPITVYFSGAKPGDFNPIAGYRVYEDVGATGSYLLVANIDSKETSGMYQTHAVNQMGTTCRYKVSTVGQHGESPLSDMFAEYTTASYGACTPPTSVTIDRNNSDVGGKANLYWSGAEDGENSSIVRYAVYRSTRSDRDYEKLFETTGFTAEVTASETEGQIYYFKVQSIAEDPAYNSELSGVYAWIKTNITTGFGNNSVPASAAFHAAIKNGSKQRALIYFYDDGLWLTNDDIVSSGIDYENYFCTEEDFSIGITSCASVSFSIFNERHRLDYMRFGRFRASLGAMTASNKFDAFGNVTAIYQGDVISGHDEYPYVRVNKVGLNDQPDFPIKSIFVMNERIYCIGYGEKFIVYERDLTTQRNDVKQYTWQQVAVMTWAELRQIVWGEDTRFVKDENGRINSLMLAVSERYADRNIGIVVESDNTITDYLPNGISETYTYVDLGIFFANRPARTKTNIISVEGYDAMSKFDVSTDNMAITFPITLYGLLNTVCAFVGVEHKVEDFINQDITLEEDSDIFQSTTAREVVGYIAEAAGANAKIDYDGKLMFAWWSETNLVIDESDYASFVPYEYSVKPIDKLQIRSGEDDIGVLVGEGVNGYVIQENPFLTFSSDEEGQVVANPIYEMLSFIPEYTPGDAKWFGDWSYRPGDVITIMYGGVSYRYPIFGYRLKWSGTVSIELESTGNEYREVLDAVSREKYAVGRKMLQINKSIDGVSLIASEAKKTSDGTSEKVAEFEATVKGFDFRVKEIESGQSELESQVSQTAGEIAAKVSKGEVIAAINLTPENAKISAPKISLEGIVTANEKFKVLLDGSIEARDGKFSGELSSGNWSFDQQGSKYTNGGQSVNMTVLSGSFVGGGSGTRAFFGSTGLDVQYGSDYNKTTFIRAGDIRFIVQSHSDMSNYASAGFKRSDTGQVCFVCGESTGASTTDTNSSGNLGYKDQYWDCTYTRILRAGTYPGSSSRKIKRDIEVLPEMGETIDKLTPVSFAYQSDPNITRYGLIYEDTKDVMPVVCFDDGKGEPGIVYTDLIAPMLKEIQSLRKRIKDLEERK